MEEPNMAVQLVEELVKAGADPGRYQEAILLRAFQCKWPACTAALRERCGADINKLADAAFAEDARKNAINKTFSGSLDAAQHAPPSTVLRGPQYLKLSLVAETEKHVDYINSAHLNAAGTTLFTACNDGFLRLFRVSDGAEVGQSVFECGSLMQAAWSPDGQCVATAGTNGRLGVHDTATDALPLLFDFEHVNPTTHELSKLYSVEYSPDGQSIATCSHDGILRFFDAKSGALKYTSSDLEDGVFVGTYAAGGTRFVAAWQQLGLVRVFDSSDGTVIAEKVISTSAMPYKISASPDGARVALACGDGIVRLFSAESCDLVAELEWHGGAVSSAVFSQDGKSILTATGDGNLRLFDAESTAIVASTACPFDPVWLKEATFSSDDRSIVTCSCDGVARVFSFSLAEEHPANAPTNTNSTSATGGAGSADDDDDDDNEEDDDALCEDTVVTEGGSAEQDQAAHMYRKVIAAIEEYDDDETEASEMNQPLVHMGQSLPQRVLNTAPANCEPAVVVAASQQKLGALQVLLYSGGNLKALALDGRTLLHVVVEQGASADFALAEFLCCAGLSVTDLSKGGRAVFFDLQKRDLVGTLRAAAESVEAMALVNDLDMAMELEESGSTGSAADSDDDNDDDDDAVLDREQNADVHNPQHAANNYAKLVSAIEGYDDEFPESHECNEDLVELARVIHATELNSPPEGCEPAVVVACLNQKLGAVSILLYSGCSFKACSLGGKSLLHVAMSNPSRLNVPLADMLCDLGMSLSDCVGGAESTIYDDLVRAGFVPALEERAAEASPGLVSRQLQDLKEPITPATAGVAAVKTLNIDFVDEDEV